MTSLLTRRRTALRSSTLEYSSGRPTSPSALWTMRPAATPSMRPPFPPLGAPPELWRFSLITWIDFTFTAQVQCHARQFVLAPTEPECIKPHIVVTLPRCKNHEHPSNAGPFLQICIHVKENLVSRSASDGPLGALWCRAPVSSPSDRVAIKPARAVASAAIRAHRRRGD